MFELVLVWVDHPKHNQRLVDRQTAQAMTGWQTDSTSNDRRLVDRQPAQAMTGDWLTDSTSNDRRLVDRQTAQAMTGDWLTASTSNDRDWLTASTSNDRDWLTASTNNDRDWLTDRHRKQWPETDSTESAKVCTGRETLSAAAACRHWVRPPISVTDLPDLPRQGAIYHASVKTGRVNERKLSLSWGLRV